MSSSRVRSTDVTRPTPARIALLALAAGAASAFAQPSVAELEERFNNALADAPGGTGDAIDPFAAFDDEQPGDVDIRVSEHDLVDLHVNNEELGTVLQLLSIQSQRNIVSSQNVAATITANLYGVTFYEALDAILHVNGYGYVERGNFIYVYTTEELLEIEQAQVQRESRIIHLQYLNAEDAAAFALPLLSENGVITSSARADAFPGLESPVGGEDYANQARLIVYDFPERLDQIEDLVRSIDTRPAQVLVEATILQTTLSEANAFGVDFALIADLDFADFVNLGGPLNATNALIDGGDGSSIILPDDGTGRSINSNTGNVAGEATFKAGIVGGDVAVFLRLLDQVTDITVVSNPKLLTLNRQPARVLVGTRVGYLNTTATETSTTQSVEFLDTGTQLAFRPWVTDDGLIRMELRPQVSSVSLRTVTDSNNVTITIPDEDTSELTTNVLVRDGQTVVLGGLFTETTTANRRQVPLLGDIPIIGSAFRGHDDSTRRAEIIFMITPTIVNDEVLTLQGETGLNYLNNARLGARQGLLPWSRERRVSQLMVEAQRAASEGDVDGAIFKLDRALALNPNAADVIEMRHRLLGEREYWPSRSWVEDIVNQELDRLIGGAGAAAAANPWPELDADSGLTDSTEPQPEPELDPEPQPVDDAPTIGFKHSSEALDGATPDDADSVARILGPAPTPREDGLTELPMVDSPSVAVATHINEEPIIENPVVSDEPDAVVASVDDETEGDDPEPLDEEEVVTAVDPDDGTE